MNRLLIISVSISSDNNDDNNNGQQNNSEENGEGIASGKQTFSRIIQFI